MSHKYVLAATGLAALGGVAMGRSARGRRAENRDRYLPDEWKAYYRDEKRAKELRDKSLREGDLAVRATWAGKHKQSEKHWATASRLEKEARALSVKWAGGKPGARAARGGRDPMPDAMDWSDLRFQHERGDIEGRWAGLTWKSAEGPIYEILANSPSKWIVYTWGRDVESREGDRRIGNFKTRKAAVDAARKHYYATTPGPGHGGQRSRKIWLARQGLPNRSRRGRSAQTSFCVECGTPIEYWPGEGWYHMEGSDRELALDAAHQAVPVNGKKGNRSRKILLAMQGLPNQGRRASGPILIDSATGKTLKVGDTVTDFRGEESVLTGMTPPHKPSSTGRVFVEEDWGDGKRHEGSYFPGVFNAEWKYAQGGSARGRRARTKKPKSIFVQGRRWRDSYGNTYHTADIIVDGYEVYTTPITYGYGNHYVDTTATEWLVEQGYLKGGKRRRPAWTLAREQGIDFDHQADNVRRKKDL